MEVEMDASGLHLHHQQEMCSQTLESILVCTKAVQEKKPRPAEQALKCPRCDSTNTKFCYYNNYSLTQPRYFCKSCRRYWTKGGTLRNVPVGGGCRKNKRSSSSASSSATSSNSSSSSAKIRGTHDHHHLLNQHPLLSGLPHLPYDSTCTTDLSLAFARLQQGQAANGFDHFEHLLGSNPPPHGDFLDAIRGGFLEGTPNGFHNVLYNGGVENGGMLMGMGNGSSDHEQEIMNPALVKQETCHGNGRSDESGENRVLWGFPWQMGGGGGDQVNMGHEIADSGRSQIGGWNGVGSTTWHGLLNSPLM